MGRQIIVKNQRIAAIARGAGERLAASREHFASRLTWREAATTRGPATSPRNAHTPRISLPLVCSAVLAACGNSPPSTEQANAALKELPQMQLLLGNQFNNPSLQLVSDMTCDKSGDHKFKCQVLLPKNPINGSQETMPVEFVKLDGKWRAVPEG